MNEGWMGEKAGARWHKVRGQPGRVAGTSERRSRSDLRDPGSLWGRRHRCKAAVQPWLRVAGSGLRRFGLGRGSVETSPGLRAWERLQHRWDEAVLSGLQGRAPRRPQPAGSAARRPCSLRFPRSCRTQCLQRRREMASSSHISTCLYSLRNACKNKPTLTTSATSGPKPTFLHCTRTVATLDYSPLKKLHSDLVPSLRTFAHSLRFSI
ncbi:uncharacterized protein LOC106021624 isoform X1 [Mesocricetus auratus]|uniref:Uncharacterized protein LOC106021624 isoform X1 n=1 Tax=Mesocricetus auratus TaxID=10036 RepID=A0A1U8C1N1_MESAU|nr:uncharacterized protein LOC106021624 isoform X1 [Mesocricetus auratus]